MEELIFFGLLIFFSIIDGLLRKKKKGGGPLENPEDWEPAERHDPAPRPRPRRRELPTYDAEPSYDDQWDDPRISGAPRPEYTAPYGGEAPAGSQERALPSEIWEEIAALARGDVPRSRDVEAIPDEVRSPVPGGRTPIRRAEVGVREVGTRADLFEHPVHRSHAGYGTDPSERPPAVVHGGDAPENEDVRAVKRQLAGGRNQLRRAVILQELLGPPVGLKEPGRGD